MHTLITEVLCEKVLKQLCEISELCRAVNANFFADQN